MILHQFLIIPQLAVLHGALNCVFCSSLHEFISVNLVSYIFEIPAFYLLSFEDLLAELSDYGVELFINDNSVKKSLIIMHLMYFMVKNKRYFQPQPDVYLKIHSPR